MGRVEKKSGEKRLTPDQLEHRALAMRAIGWLLLAFDSIVAVFIFVGLRDGSALWLYWTVIEGLAGIGLILAGLQLEKRAAGVMAQPVEARLHDAEGAEHRKAA